MEQIEIRLDKAQLVKAIDDGGVPMYFRRDPTSPQLSRRVVLSVEVVPAFKPLFANVSRQSGKSMNDEDTANRHAAQCYAEMLGYACHPEFYDVNIKRYFPDPLSH